MPSSPAEDRRVSLWPAAYFLMGAAALLLLLIRTGWAAEDSYISFRVVENFLAGYGLTWNPGERVQVYTDPLFVFLTILGTWVSGSVYWSSAVISLLLTMGAYFLLMYRQTLAALMVGTAILLSSKAFMDFSVSGLENPATHLGIAAFCWAYWRKKQPWLLTLIASLTAVNRQDSLLLFLPALLLVYYRAGWRVWKDVALGMTPLFAWEIFSLFYYGFPFPNTAYAKLSTGISSSDLMRQGWLYLVNDYHWDKVTASAILGGVAFGAWVGEWPLALGALASVLYVVRVGGDYMSGRFLSPALVLACAIIVQYLRVQWRPAAAMAMGILALGLVNLRPTLTTTMDFGIGAKNAEWHGIVDERAAFYSATGMLRWRPGIRWPDLAWSDMGDNYRKAGSSVVILMPIGVIPYHAGPAVHVIDVGALGNPLLARLPSMPSARRPGHYWRALPPGYYETVLTGVNQIQDRKLAAYYGLLQDIVAGDLWSARRLKEILWLNLGIYQKPTF